MTRRGLVATFVEPTAVVTDVGHYVELKDGGCEILLPWPVAYAVSLRVAKRRGTRDRVTDVTSSTGAWCRSMPT